MIHRTSLRFVSGCTALLSLAGSAACSSGAAGEAVRPKDPTANEALGEAGDCTGVSPEAQPFLVDWKDEQRGELEIAMQKGVAVLAYSCKGIKLLRDCRLPGEYGFAGYDAVKKKNIDLTSNDDVSATVPLSAASISAELKRGLALKLAYAMVGQKGTTVETAQRSDLVGSCEGATHYVRGAFVGAFAFGTATEGSVAGGAKVLGAGTSASSDSSKAIQNSDGDVAACDKHVEGQTPPSGCKALIRLMLAPISDAAAQTTQAAPSGGAQEGEPGETAAKPAVSPCNTGFVLDASGKCTKKSSATAFLCDPKSVGECVDQCKRGHGQSCYSAASLQYRQDVNPGKDHKAREEAARGFFVAGCEAGHAESCGRAGSMVAFGANADKVKSKQYLDKGCSGGDKNACSQLASHHDSGFFDGVKDPATAFRLRQRSCSLGSSFACSTVAKAQIEGNVVKRDVEAGLKTLSRSCDSGDYFNCRELAMLLVKRTMPGVPQDPQRAQSILSKLCTKSPTRSPNACDDLGTLWAEGAFGPPNLDKAKELYERGCGPKFGGLACVHLAQMYESGKGAKKNPAHALELYERACPGKGCFAAAILYEKGGAMIQTDRAKAAELYAKGCSPIDDKEFPGRGQKACSKAATIFAAHDRDKAKSMYGKACGWFKDARDCAAFKSLGGDPKQPFGGPPPGPPGPPPPPPKKS
jgi:hypothetical protein